MLVALALVILLFALVGGVAIHPLLLLLLILAGVLIVADRRSGL